MSPVRVTVIGAGVAGLAAARRIADAGHAVTVLDKGRRAGGRLATKLLAGGARADHGAQFFTVRDERLAGAVARWCADGDVHEWCRGFSSTDGHPRYCARGGMAELGARMARGLDVRTSVKVEAVRTRGADWIASWGAAHDHAAGELVCDFVILTAPPEQAAELLRDEAQVPSLAYDPMLALLLALDRPPAIAAPGGVQLSEDATWSWIADNVAKGASVRPAVTLHTRADYASSHWECDRDVLIDELLAAATPWLGGARVLDNALHRWRYAAARELHPDRCLALGDGRVLLAGDAFASPRVEGAYLSGLAAAERVLGG